jgi:hypothetical protein
VPNTLNFEVKAEIIKKNKEKEKKENKKEKEKK